MVTLNDLEKAEISRLSVRIRVQAFYKGTVAWSKFAEHQMISLLTGQIKLNNKEKAIVGTYYRMYLWMRSMADMKSRIHFQGAAAAARTLFELLLDMKILVNDKTGEFVERFHAFPEIEKFRAAENLISFSNKHPNCTKFNVSQRRKFVNKPGRRKAVEQTTINLWGITKKGKPNCPKHWTGKDVRKRAHDSGPRYEELYVRLYPLLSWHIHSGSTGYTGFSAEGIEAGFGVSHSIAQEMFLEATVICAQEMKISEAVDWFSNKIADLQVTPIRGLTEEQIKILEKARLNKNA